MRNRRFGRRKIDEGFSKYLKRAEKFLSEDANGSTVFKDNFRGIDIVVDSRRIEWNNNHQNSWKNLGKHEGFRDQDDDFEESNSFTCPVDFIIYPKETLIQKGNYSEFSFFSKSGKEEKVTIYVDMEDNSDNYINDFEKFTINIEKYWLDGLINKIDERRLKTVGSIYTLFTIKCKKLLTPLLRKKYH